MFATFICFLRVLIDLGRSLKAVYLAKFATIELYLSRVGCLAKTGFLSKRHQFCGKCFSF